MTEAMREQFEAWAKRQPQNYDLSRREFDASTYESSMTRWAWQAYQAALRSHAVAGLVEALQIARDYAAYVQGEPDDLALMDAALAQYATLAGESR